MRIPDTLFYPTLQAQKDAADPLVCSMREYLREVCDKCLTPSAPEYIDYQERQSEWWTTRPGGRRLPGAIEQLAAGGILLGEGYTEATVAILRTIVEHRIVENCGGTNYGRPYRTWRDNPLDAGASSGMLAIGLDLLRPSLSPDELARFGTYLVPFVDYILENPPDPEERRPDWNIALIGLVGTGLLALVLRSMGVLEEDRFERALERGRHRALLFLEKGHDGQGAFFEGPAYGSASVHNLCPLAFALARCGDRELVEHPGLARMVESLAHEIIPGTGTLNPLNDCGDTVNVSWLPLVAAQQQSGLAQWVWQTVQDLPSDSSVPAGFDWSDAVTRYLLYYDPAIEPVSPERTGLPRVEHFQQRGLVDIRSGWGEEDFFLSFLCDVFPAGGHRQADRGHFSLHALGESFAIDSGYALERLPDTTEVLRLGAMGEAHNLPLIHGEMQRRGQVSSDGIRRAELALPTPYIEAEAGESYASARRFTRRMVCLPGSDDAPFCAMVADLLTFELSEQRPMLSWLLHTRAGNRVQLERDHLTIFGDHQGNCCHVHMVTPWPGRWKEETFFDHPRLRYDWFWEPLLCLVALIPRRQGESSPEIRTWGEAEGCALYLSIGDTLCTVLCAAPDQVIRFNGIETDAEFVLVRTRGDQVEDYILTAGTRLAVQGEIFVQEPAPVEFAVPLD